MLSTKIFQSSLTLNKWTLRSLIRHSTASATNSLEETYFRTSEIDPANHSVNQIGRIYTVDPEVPRLFGKELNPKDNYYANNYFGPRQWVDRCSSLKETGIMVRDPAVQIINSIRHLDLEKPAVRFVLYGRPGCGKSISLSHLTHYGHSQGFITMTFSQIKKWLTKYYEIAPSTHTPGHVDHVMNSNIFLKNFKQANLWRLSSESLVTHKDYVWSAREKTPAGSPLMDIIEMGCERLAYAADALNIVIRELKLNCNDGNCKLMVVCDGVNSLFSETTLVNKDRKMWKTGPFNRGSHWIRGCVKVDECSVPRNIKKLLRNDYKNAVIVTSACSGATIKDVHDKPPPAHRWYIRMERQMVPNFSSHLPFNLLGEEGWRTFDPFVPVEVGNYSEAELDAMIDYYIERGWLGAECGDKAGRQEIHFLTGRNPGDFFKFSSSF